MDIRTDFSKGCGYELIEEGIQEVEIMSMEESTVKSGKFAGDPQVIFDLMANNGGRTKLFCTNSDRCRWQLKKVYQAVTEILPDSGPMTLYENEFIGKKIKVEIYHDEWNGKPSAKVKDIILPEIVSPGQTDINDFQSGELVGAEGEPLPF